MNNGEKKVYKRGVSLTFRLPKKMKYSDDVIKLINAASDADELNVEIIRALELYAKYKHYKNQYVGSDIDDFQRKFFNENKATDENAKVQEPIHKDTNIIKVENWNQNSSDNDANDAEDELFDDDKPQNKGLANAFSSLRKRK